jgi:hypothetical protein
LPLICRAVHDGTATPEYQNPTLFFQRTFITEGMRLLLDSVVKRLLVRAAIRSSSCKQPSAAARRTRMLAVYHLAKGEAVAS